MTAAWKSWLDNWEEEELKCCCGWAGRGSQAGLDADTSAITRMEHVTLGCPKCGEALLHLRLATHDEIRAEAARGNPKACAELPQIERIEQRWARRDDTVLHEPAQLPDVPGDRFVVYFATEKDEQDETWLVLRANGREIYHELAVWESLEPIERIFPILQAKYGDHFVGVNTAGAAMYFCGDMLSSVERLRALEAAVDKGAHGSRERDRGGK